MGKEIEITQELLDKARDGDEASNNLLYQGFYKLLHYFSKKWVRKIWANDYSMHEELVSISHIAYMKALNSFDLSKGVKFATYLSRCVENEILMHYRKYKKTRLDISFDAPVNTGIDGNELHLIDTWGSEEKGYESLEFREGIWKELQEFGVNEKYGNLIIPSLIEHRVQRNIQEELGVSQSYISRLVKKQVSKFRKQLVRNNLMDGGELVHRSTYSKEQKDKVKFLLETTLMLQQDIAKETGVNQATVSYICKKVVRPEGAFRSKKKEEVDGEVNTTFWTKEQVKDYFGEETKPSSKEDGLQVEIPQNIDTTPQEGTPWNIDTTLQEVTTEHLEEVQQPPTESISAEEHNASLCDQDCSMSGITTLELVKEKMSVDRLEWEITNLIKYLRGSKSSNLSLELRISF